MTKQVKKQVYTVVLLVDDVRVIGANGQTEVTMTLSKDAIKHMYEVVIKNNKTEEST